MLGEPCGVDEPGSPRSSGRKLRMHRLSPTLRKFRPLWTAALLMLASAGCTRVPTDRAGSPSDNPTDPSPSGRHAENGSSGKSDMPDEQRPPPPLVGDAADQRGKHCHDKLWHDNAGADQGGRPRR